jgi:hypothetical protein
MMNDTLDPRSDGCPGSTAPLPHLTAYHPKQITRARRYTRALAIVNVKLDDISNQIYRHLIAAGDEVAAKHVLWMFRDQVSDLNDFLHPKFLKEIDGWARATPPDELRRLGVVIPSADPRPWQECRRLHRRPPRQNR